MNGTEEDALRQKDARITELERQNEILSREVKRLIKAESRLYSYQEVLDAQLKEYQDLYQLNRKLSERLGLLEICSVATDFIVMNLDYERALFLDLNEADGTYHICAMAGYYEEKEKERVEGVVVGPDAPVLQHVDGREYVVVAPGTADPETTAFGASVGLAEYVMYPLGIHLQRPYALLVVGNSGINLHFYRRVSDSECTHLSMGNVIGAISSSMENYIFYHKIEESEWNYRQLSQVLEQRVREAVEELRRKDKILMLQSRQALMGEMISNIAHQWRQPLNILGLLAQEMQMTKELGEVSKEFIDDNVRKTMETIQQMSKTIDDFRNFFLPDKEKVEFRLSDAIHRTVSLLAGSFKARQISTKVEESADPVIAGYPGEFTQVLVNILINARDALLSGNTLNPRITIVLFTEADRRVVTIADNAGGVPDEIIDRVFDPYFTTKGPEQGTGIGLFMCKMIIEKSMGGSLTVRNTGEGAEFRIEV